jgi:hypothetical protein
VPLVVDFKFEGKFYPATRDTPAEYPEVLINSITAEDSEIDIQGMLHWKAMEEIQSLIDA